MKKQFFMLGILLCLFFQVSAQNITLEGYVFEDNNRGYLNLVEVTIIDQATNTQLGIYSTNKDGFFSTSLPAGKNLLVKLSKDLFFDKQQVVSTTGKSAGEKVYLKVKMERKPGYIFDVTLAEARNATNVNAITGAKIEVYNNTKLAETLLLDSITEPNFNVTFERGNHYTVMIRKDGYFNKRLEAYVDVEGCILCFEGVGTITPGVSDVMTQGFQMGSVLANIELEPAQIGKTITIENIYYDYNEANIRSDAALELKKLIGVLRDNPSIILELGSHTDSRGGNESNMKLSQDRAEAAVDYIITNGNISPTRLKAQGYGETKRVTKCRKCSEEEHAKNRRTELRILGFEDHDPFKDRSLGDILQEERLMREIQESEIIEVPKGGKIPENLKKSKGN